MKIPPRWLNYNDSAHISGTRFVAFKTPLRENFSTSVNADKRFTPRSLLQKHPNIKLIIDLTFTTKYYDGLKEFEAKGIRYIKIKCVGRKVPKDSDFQKFLKIVDEFIATSPEHYLIGIHCTHGVNRTGYFIVGYMIERLRYTSQKALREFLTSRGHAIERTAYIVELRRKQKSIRRV